MIKMVPLTCPKCNASIDVKEGMTSCYCTYCGTKISIGDNSTFTINVNQNITDQYKIEKLRWQQQMYQEVKERGPAQTKKTGITFIVLLGIISVMLSRYILRLTILNLFPNITNHLIENRFECWVDVVDT